VTDNPTNGADYRFDLDLPKGRIAEHLLREILCGGGSGTKVEVKRDYKVSETGNVAIEYQSRGHKSGISVSEADWWAHALSGPCYDGDEEQPEVIVLIKLRRLKRILRSLRDRGVLRSVPGGDDGTSTMALLRIGQLLVPMPRIEDL
jgi:hypothetical protein